MLNIRQTTYDLHDLGFAYQDSQFALLRNLQWGEVKPIAEERMKAGELRRSFWRRLFRARARQPSLPGIRTPGSFSSVTEDLGFRGRILRELDVFGNIKANASPFRTLARGS
jgi:hypothetical protein